MPGTTVTGEHFMHDLDASSGSELKIGSLFSGYGGLDLAVERFEADPQLLDFEHLVLRLGHISDPSGLGHRAGRHQGS